MRYMQSDDKRIAFREWLRSEFRRLEFYQRRGDRYLVSEFARYAEGQGAKIDEVSLGRYVRLDGPVLPTPESCRELAKALGIPGYHALMQAGYITQQDYDEIDAAVRATILAQIDELDVAMAR